MKNEELLALVPFYVAGTLDPEEKESVDKNLSLSPELQTELAFWRRAQYATVSYVEYLKQGHPSSEELVDYVEQTLTGYRSELIDKHLRECGNCREEFDITVNTFPENKTSRQTHSEATPKKVLSDILYRFLNPSIAVPAVALILLAYFLFREKPSEPVDEERFLVLTYQQTIRGTELPPPQQISLPTSVSIVHATLLVPHNDIASINYTMMFLSPDQVIKQIPERVSIVRGAQFDRLQTNIGRNYFSGNGTYQIVVKEQFSDSLKELTPDEFTYTFAVSGM